MSDGWVGVPWEAVLKCEHCGIGVSATTAQLLREVKAGHRETCPDEDGNGVLPAWAKDLG